MLCSLILVSGCDKKNTPKVPQSIKTYKNITFTAEQTKKLSEIRTTERTKMEAIRKELTKQREELLDLDGTKKLTPEQRKINQEKYRELSAKTRAKMDAERDNYDKAVMNILDDKQKATYQKY